jgi:hypothetical protein
VTPTTNNTQNNGFIFHIQHNDTYNSIGCRYAEYRYAECHFAECREAIVALLALATLTNRTNHICFLSPKEARPDNKDK